MVNAPKLLQMLHILVNYNFTPTWLLDKGIDYLIYDRSDSRDFLKDFDQSKIIYRENIGNVDYDKLTYLVDSYYDLPDVFVWGKTNLFKYITEEEYEKVANNKAFTPLLTMGHKTYSDKHGVVCEYQNEMYWERNDSWYFGQFSQKHVSNFGEWAEMFNLPNPAYIPFAPGGNYILTKETVHKYPREFYKKMLDTLPYTGLPVEAYCAERSYYLLWA